MSFSDRAVHAGLTWKYDKGLLDMMREGPLVEVAGAAHTVPGDKPEEFARVVRSFLGE